MNSSKHTLGSYANLISRYTQAYANEVLAKYKLSSGTFPYLLVLDRKEGINQNEISKELNIDKSMSARAIRKLIKLKYVTKNEDNADSRAFKLYLTKKGKEVIPALKEELRCWNKFLTQGFSEEEEEKLVDLLSRVLDNASKYKEAINSRLNDREGIAGKD